MSAQVRNKPHKKQCIASRDGGARCRYCGVRRRLRSLTIDHITPRSRGGTHELANLALACKACNGAKRNYLPTEWQVAA